MSKRELAEPEDRPARKQVENDDEMGEFEDPFEDEIESDEGEVVDAADEDTMDIDGQPLHGKIQELGDDDDEEPKQEEQPVALNDDELSQVFHFRLLLLSFQFYKFW